MQDSKVKKLARIIDIFSIEQGKSNSDGNKISDK